MQLNNASLASLAKEIVAPDYDRKNVSTGIVHLGIGAFHRSHQAYFTELALSLDNSWGICGVSLNSTTVRDKLAPQDCLYTLVTQGSSSEFRVIAAVQEVLHLGQQREMVKQRLNSPSTKVVTLTITEKGYYLNAEGDLDTQNPAIKHDIENPDAPNTAIGLIAQALLYRQNNGLRPATIISCDNVASNGIKLKKAVKQFALKAFNSAFAESIDKDVHFPCTMVDCITPATDQALCDSIEQQFFYKDAWPIKREPFAQWVIESTPATDLPPWDQVGVTFTNDVDGFENAKLRLLNLPHSALAYIGELLGLDSVYQAINHPALAHFVSDMLHEEAIPSFAQPDGLDVSKYTADIIERFKNPSIEHLLAQIACDGTPKLLMRVIPTIKDNLIQGNPIDKLCAVLAAWMAFIQKRANDNATLVDPNSELLLDLANSLNDDPKQNLQQWLKLDILFDRALLNNEVFIHSIETAYSTLSTQGIDELISMHR